MKRIAVVGTGVSGALAARLLSTKHEVVVFEANDYLGGHANTVDVSLGGRNFPVDTGFMVFNSRTYPNFCKLLDHLNIAAHATDMSFSVRCGDTGLEYQGSSLNGVFAQRSNLFRPGFLGMIRDILRFNARARKALAAKSLDDDLTVGELIDRWRLGARFVQHYLVPMTAAIWSSRRDAILEFPARFLLGFFHNHGLIQLRDRPQWQVITGGSRQYMQALLEPIRDRILLGTPVESVTRGTEQVVVKTRSGEVCSFDEVVMATHADQTLQILSDASEDERSILSAFPYQPNRAVLHTDERFLPQRSRARASWNYYLSESNSLPAVTYDLSRLQGHDSPQPILLTLNPVKDVDPASVLRTLNYSHPTFSKESSAAQVRHDCISGRNRTHYCGAYWGYGFHEDGVNSALAVVNRFGLELDSCTVASLKASLDTAGFGP